MVVLLERESHWRSMVAYLKAEGIHVLGSAMLTALLISLSPDTSLKIAP